MRDSTLCILVKLQAGKIAGVLLAMKKRGFGQGWWNGYGGKVEDGETVEQALAREVREEAEVELEAAEKVAEIGFSFPHKPVWDQLMHVYLAHTWRGEPKETEEMKPRWFKTAEIPYGKMWPGDEHWMSQIFAGKKVRGEIVFGEEHTLLNYNINLVDFL